MASRMISLQPIFAAEWGITVLTIEAVKAKTSACLAVD